MAVLPATYGNADRTPRGDYSRARDDDTCEQDWSSYAAAEHALYAQLFERQVRQIPGRACDEFAQALGDLGETTQIPRSEDVSRRLRRATAGKSSPSPD